MGFWAYDVTYGLVLNELPTMLDVIRRAGVDWYVIHGRAASILQSVRRTGRSGLATKDMDFLVGSNDAVERMYKVVQDGEDAGHGEPRKPIYKSCTPVYGSLDGRKPVGMRGLDIKTINGVRIEARNAMFYMGGENSNNITTGDKTAAETVCLPKEMTGYVEDVYVSLRPLIFLISDSKELAEHHGKQRELNLKTLKELERLL